MKMKKLILIVCGTVLFSFPFISSVKSQDYTKKQTSGNKKKQIKNFRLPQKKKNAWYLWVTP